MNIDWDKHKKRRLSVAIALFLLSNYQSVLPTRAADNLCISNIYINPENQFVVEFDNQSHTDPLTPLVRDYPGLQHDIVLEFPKATFVVGKIPAAKVMLDQLSKTFPDVRSIAYATANDGTLARIRLSISPNISAHPYLAKITQDAATINLDLPKTKDSAPAPTQNTDKQITEPQETPAITKEIKAEEESKPAVELANSTSNLSPDNSSDKTTTENTNDNNSATNDGGVASKAIHGIKGAWHSSLKAGQNQAGKLGKLHNPLKFGHNKQNDQTNTESETKSDATQNEENKEATSNSATEGVANISPTPEGSTAAAAPTPEIPAEPKAAPEMVADKNATTTSAEPPTPEPIVPQVTERIEAKNSEASDPNQNEKIPAPKEVETPVKNTQKEAESLIQPLPVEKTVSAPVPEKQITVDAVSPSEESHEKADLADLTPKLKNEETKIASILPTEEDKAVEAMAKNKAAVETTKATSPNPNNESVILKSLKATPGDKNLYPPSKARATAIEHYNKAVHLHLADKLPEAIIEYKLALVANPKLAEAYSNLGLIYNQQNKYDQAMTEFHKALAINSKDAITYNGIGASLRAQKNMPAAIKNWQTAITLDPNLASAHYNLGTAYELNKEYEKALAEYKECIKHDSNLGEAYYRMGLVLNKLDNRTLAIEEFKQAINVSPQANYVEDAKLMVNQLSQRKTKK